jgi:hypothetical protein
MPIISTDVIGVDIGYALNTGEFFILAEGTRLIGTGSSFIQSNGPTNGINFTFDGYLWLQADPTLLFVLPGSHLPDMPGSLWARRLAEPHL